MSKFLAFFFLAAAATALLTEAESAALVPESKKTDLIIPGNNGNNVKITILDSKKPQAKKLMIGAPRKNGVRARKQGDYSWDNFQTQMQEIPYCEAAMPTAQEIEELLTYLLELEQNFPEGDIIQADSGYMYRVFCMLGKFYATSDKVIKEELERENQGASGDQTGQNTGDGSTQVSAGGDSGSGDESGDGSGDGSGEGSGDGSSGNGGDDGSGTGDNGSYNPDQGSGDGAGLGDQQTQNDQSTQNSGEWDPLLSQYPEGYTLLNNQGGYDWHKKDGSVESVSIVYFDENNEPKPPSADGLQRVRKAARVQLQNFRFTRRNSQRNSNAHQFRNIFRHSL